MIHSFPIKNKLYGDGVHDDLPAIQEMLDSGVSCLYLPPPQKHYLISGTIFMHSNQELHLDRYTRVRLADGSNCTMIENADPKEWNTDIVIDGGIWDMNHKNQYSNPLHYPNPETGLTFPQWMQQTGYDRNSGIMPKIYTGACFIFNRIKRFTLRNMTVVNPVMFGIWLVYVEDFTVENIEFQYNEGSPKLWNLDGIHIEGGCKNGVVRNLKGACHDDMVAITSDDTIYGPIENILVDGIFAEGSHSAVRLLSVRNPVRNVHLTNIFGTYYVYCIVMSKYHDQLKGRSRFENITIDNIYASMCPGTVDVPGNYSPLIAIGPDMDIKSLYIANLHRDETHCPTPTIGIERGTHIRRFAISHCEQTNITEMPMSFINNAGEIDILSLNSVDCNGDEIYCGEGKVKEFRA